MANQKLNTKVVTGVVRLSYEHVWEPASVNGSNPKYSVSLIIPKSDTKTIAAINAAVENAIKNGAGASAPAAACEILGEEVSGDGKRRLC